MSTTAQPVPQTALPEAGTLSRLVGSVIAPAASPAVWLAAIIGLAISASALVVMALAVVEGEITISLFQAVVAIAGLVPLAVALGKTPDGPGLALACGASAPLVSPVLVEPATITALLGAQGQPLTLGPLPLLPIMYGHLAGGALIAVAAALSVWSVRPERSAWYLIRSAAAGLPLVLIMAAAVAPPLRDRLGGLPAILKATGFIAVFFAGLALVSIAGHCLIRSFEVADRGASDHPSPDEQAPTA